MKQRLHIRLEIPARYGSGDSLISAPDGSLWFALSDAAALGRFDPVSGAFAPFGLQHGFKAEALALATDGTFYAAKFDERAAILRFRHRVTTILPVAGAEIGALAAGDNGDLWFLHRKPPRLGHILRNGSVQIRTLEHGDPGGPIAFDRSSVWVADADSGLWRIDASTGQKTYVPMPDRRSHANPIAFARNGVAWIGETIGDQRCFSDCGAVVRIAP